MTESPQIKRRSHSGVSLVELMLVVSIGSLLTLGISTLLNALNKASRRAERQIFSIGEETLGNRQIWFDLRASGISFNFLSAGPCGSPPNPPDFYDFLPDMACVPPTEVLTAMASSDPKVAAIALDPAKNPCARKLTLTLPADGTAAPTLVLALSKGGLAPAMPLSPLNFYNWTVPEDQLNESGKLEFSPEKLKGILKTLNGMPEPGLLTDGNVLRFYSPITMRPMAKMLNASAIGTQADLSIPPRMVSLISVVRSGDLVTTQPSWLQCERHPTMNVDLAAPGGKYEPLDTFFRLMPPVGGRSAFGMVMPIDVVRYRLTPSKMNGKDTAMLVREKYDAQKDSWVGTHMVANGVASVEFLRKTISVPSIKATITMDKQAFSAGKDQF